MPRALLRTLRETMATMAADLRHAGMGWPTGAVKGGNSRILSLPSDDLLLLGSEHWHHDEAVQAGKRVLFRGMARQGFRPAEVGWNVVRYVDEITRDAVRVSDPITDFVGWNELNLQDERGDQRSDFGDLNDLYALLGQFCLGVISELRRRPSTRNARLHFGAWAPKDETDYTRHWRAAAEMADVIDVHAYGLGPGILAHVAKYRALFPSTPIELTEWHSDFDGPQADRDTLALFANEAAVHPDFRAYYFLWRWDSPPAHQRDLADAIAVEGNAERLALFRDPPRAAEPEEPKPMYRVPTWTPAYEDIRDGAILVADEVGIPKRRLLGLCLAESGFGLQSFDRWASIERSARMTTAIKQEDWPRVEAIFSEIKGTPTNDLSWGPAHQTWYWSDEYPGDRSPNDPHRHNLEEIMAFRAHYIEDHGMALRVAAGKIKGDVFDDLAYLCWYNKPSVPPAQNPNRPNYERSLIEADRILAGLFPQQPEEPGQPSGIVYEDYRDPQPAGTFAAMPRGIILHGSRSGKAGNPQESEYKGTASYEVNNTSGLGWHATIADHRVAIHLDPHAWGWHALEASKVYIGVELAQPTVDDPITDAQVDALADWITTRILPVWPGLPMHFPSHPEADREFGVNQGKSDAFPIGDTRMDDLRARLMARLKPAEPEQPSQYQYVLGFADLAARLGAEIVGDPVEHEHDAEQGGHAIRHQLTTRGQMVYWKDANRAEFYHAA